MSKYKVGQRLKVIKAHYNLFALNDPFIIINIVNSTYDQEIWIKNLRTNWIGFLHERNVPLYLKESPPVSHLPDFL